MWQNIGQGPNKISLTPEAQLDRWKIFLTQWEKAMQEEKETVVLGDVKINWLCLVSEDPPACPRQAAKWRAARPLLDELDRRITPEGVVQLVQGVTRSARGQADSMLDLLDVPEKMSEVRTVLQSYSDHGLILCSRFTKNIITSPRYVKKRSFKNFSEIDFVNAVENLNMLDIYLCQDASEAASMLTEKLNIILDEMAPIKKIQVRHNYAPWVSDARRGWRPGTPPR